MLCVLPSSAVLSSWFVLIFCPGTHRVALAGLKFTELFLHLLGLKLHATMPSCIYFVFKSIILLLKILSIIHYFFVVQSPEGVSYEKVSSFSSKISKSTFCPFSPPAQCLLSFGSWSFCLLRRVNVSSLTFPLSLHHSTTLPFPAKHS